MAKYYIVKLGVDDEFSVAVASAPPPSALPSAVVQSTVQLATAPPEPQIPFPHEIDQLLRRCKMAFEEIQLQIAPGTGRTFYAKWLLHQVRAGLEDGEDIDKANITLDQFDTKNLGVKYFDVELVGSNVKATPMKWAPKPMPNEATVFLSAIDATITKIEHLIPGSPKKTNYFNIVESHAKHGLGAGEIQGATIALADFKQQFVDDEGPAIRARYIVSTLKTAGWTCAIAALAGIVVSLASLHLPNCLAPFQHTMQGLHKFAPTFIALAFGTALGISFFAFVRNMQMTFDSLGRFDSASLDPYLRFLLVALIVIIACALLRTGVAKIELGGIKLEEFAQHRLSAFVLGILCGYSDATITGVLTGALDKKRPI